MKLSRGLIACVLVAAAIALTSSPASSAPARTVRGEVVCVSQRSVVGVWIKAENGGSGWATRSGSGYRQNYSYRLPNGGRYQVHVGCGGSSGNWATNNKSGYVSGSTNSFTCYDVRGNPMYLRCQRT